MDDQQQTEAIPAWLANTTSPLEPDSKAARMERKGYGPNVIMRPVDEEYQRSPENQRLTLALMHAEYEQIFYRVIDLVAKGQSIAQIIRNDPRDIDYNDFYRWIRASKKRLSLYEEAQELRAEAMACELVDIADAVNNTLEDVQRSKLRIDTRKYIMGAHYRRRYGEVKQIEVNQTISITSALAEAKSRVFDGVTGEFIEE